MAASSTLIDQELAAADEAWRADNAGKARVCARRAVARASEIWLARLSVPQGKGDALEHLRRIQEETSFPLPVRQAAERLSTKVTRQHAAPFTTDPISDARLIISHLSASDL